MQWQQPPAQMVGKHCWSTSQKVTRKPLRKRTATTVQCFPIRYDVPSGARRLTCLLAKADAEFFGESSRARLLTADCPDRFPPPGSRASALAHDTACTGHSCTISMEPVSELRGVHSLERRRRAPRAEKSAGPPHPSGAHAAGLGRALFRGARIETEEGERREGEQAGGGAEGGGRKGAPCPWRGEPRTPRRVTPRAATAPPAASPPRWPAAARR